MSTYSSFFTAGLYLTAKGRDSSASPAPSPLSSASVSGSSTFGDTAPKLNRKRRSSLTISISPMAAFKSPLRSATFAKQQAILRSPVRERSGYILHSQPPHPLFFDGNVKPTPQELKRSVTTTVISRVRGRLPLPSLNRPAPNVPLPDLPATSPLSTAIPDSSLTMMPSSMDSPMLLREPLSTLQSVANVSSAIAPSTSVPAKPGSRGDYTGRSNSVSDTAATADTDYDMELTKENVQSL